MPTDNDDRRCRRYNAESYGLNSFHCPVLVQRMTSQIAKLFVQQRIELGPHFIFLRAGLMAVAALFLRLQFGSWSLRFMMVEIVVAPASGIGITLGILDGHVGSVKGPGEIAPPRRFHSGAIRFLPRQRELQLLEKNCPFGKHVRLLVNLVRTWLDIDIVKFRETGHAVIEGVGSERRSDVYPLVEVLRQDQIARGGVLRQIARPRLRTTSSKRF